MSLCQIGYVNIIPDTGAILCVIIISENADIIALSQRNLENQRDQVGLRAVCFTDTAAFMSTAGIEIAQRNKFEAMSLICPHHHFFHSQLGLTVCIGGTGIIIFQDRNVFRLSVGSSSGREDNFLDIVGNHGLQ